MRERARRFGFELATLSGLRDMGFFIPYRFAKSVEPVAYPALEPLFLRAEPAFRQLLGVAQCYSADLLRILDGPGPARFDQDWFPRLDAAIAYAIVRDERPRRIVEIGSGHSTRFLARAGEDGRLEIDIVAIDPEPRAALEGLRVRQERTLLRSADPGFIAALEPGDILFVDSSHVAMPGSDVDIIVGDLLPRLPAGVLVHIHDVVLPDPYPAEWAWRGYNEATVVAALLGAGGYDVLFSSHWVASRHPEWLLNGIVGRLPLLTSARETSLWLRKR